jgi:uncharacterized protein (DUF1501 family)
MARCNHCSDFSRAHLLREGVAQAGAGLPSIEQGMPTPAGTGLSRRTFLANSTGFALSIYGAAQIPLGVFDEGIAEAATVSNPIFISVFMAGGIDALNLLAPVNNSKYQTWRPTLAVKQNEGTAYSADANYRWHPSAAGLATLHGEGKVAVLPGVGYDHPNQSHFTSRHFWEVGSLATDGRIGWMGRMLDQMGDMSNPLQGLSLANSLYPSLATGSVPVAAVSSPSGYSFSAQGVGSPIAAPMLEAMGALGSLSADSPALSKARNATREASLVRKALEPFKTPTSTITYPTGNQFPQQLKELAAMIASGLPLKCVAINAAGGYDTHAGQRTAFESGVKMTMDSLLAFQRDIEARGVADRVVVQVWSEFGRRPKENGDAGTDHGTGGISFLIGSKVAGGQVGEFPGLDVLDSSGNLRATSDFRGVYASIIEQWFNLDAADVIPNANSFARYRLIR